MCNETAQSGCGNKLQHFYSKPSLDFIAMDVYFEQRDRVGRPEQSRAIINGIFLDFVALRHCGMAYHNMANRLQSIDGSRWRK